jgi:UPF0716 protein FxsA
MRGTWPIVVVLSLPIAELMSILLAAQFVGALATFLLLAAGVIMGLFALRMTGRKAFAELRRELRPDGQIHHLDVRVFRGSLRFALVSVLFLIPGFVSDVAAVIIAISAIPDLFRRHPTSLSPRRDGTVELDKAEYRRLDESRS